MFRRSLRARVGTGIQPSTLKSFFVIIFALAFMVIISGCSPVAGPAAKPTATPTAQQILAHAKSAKLTDETFTLTMQTPEQATPQPTPSITGSINATATGKATSNPERVAMSMSMTVAGTTIAFDEVFDGPTKSTYIKITAPASLATNTWQKNPVGSDLFSASSMQLLPSYDKVTNPKLVGSEQLNGVSVWHVQGTVVQAGVNESVDMFVRQSDYLPAKMVIHTTGDAALDLTIVYTAVNTGITIEVPTV
jgi:hypothetical protein